MAIQIIDRKKSSSVGTLYLLDSEKKRTSGGVGGLKVFENFVVFDSHEVGMKEGFVSEQPFMLIALDGDITIDMDKFDSNVLLHKGDVMVCSNWQDEKITMTLKPNSTLLKLGIDKKIEMVSDRIMQYNPSHFKIRIGHALHERIYIGDGSPIGLGDGKLELKEMQLAYRIHNLSLRDNQNTWFYIVKGELNIHDSKLEQGELVEITDIDHLVVKPLQDSRILMICWKAER